MYLLRVLHVVVFPSLAVYIFCPLHIPSTWRLHFPLTGHSPKQPVLRVFTDPAIRQAGRVFHAPTLPCLPTLVGNACDGMTAMVTMTGRKPHGEYLGVDRKEGKQARGWNATARQQQQATQGRKEANYISAAFTNFHTPPPCSIVQRMRERSERILGPSCLGMYTFMLQRGKEGSSILF
ncbi:hypothetical protein LZ32DRAFT_607780 [Colletotrichum eremochloae]|nr:hypothetical protein LZ32DRAFT_607780 [Colletotrichum eremochloae]